MTLTKAEIKSIEKILEKKPLRGRKRLEDWLWANTTDPKYKVGDCFEVTDRSRFIWGVRVVGFHAKITEVRWAMVDRTVDYTLEGIVKNGDRQMPAKFFVRESELRVRVNDNVTVINGRKDSPEDEMTIW